MKDALDTREIIKYSPRREGIFQHLKETLATESTAGIRILCPTRWTVHAESIKSIIENYKTLESTWEEAITASNDTETKARIQGVAAQMRNFTFFFGLLLGELVLRHTDNLSRTLQHVSMSAAEGQKVAVMTVTILKSIRNDASFDQLWEVVCKKAELLGINDPQLPRQRKLPHRYDDGLSRGDFAATPKMHFKLCYLEAIDLIVNCVEERFNQPGYQIYRMLETLLLKACMQEELEESLEAVCTFYKDDFQMDLLHSQLQTFAVHFKEVMVKESATTGNFSIFDVKKYFLSLSHGQSSLLSQVRRLLQLILIMPATKAYFQLMPHLRGRLVLFAASRITCGQQWDKRDLIIRRRLIS